MKKSARSSVASEAGNSSGAGLFRSVTSESRDLSTIVKAWYQDYKENAEAAFCDLLDFILQSCGLEAKALAVVDLASETTKEIMKKIEELAQKIQSYPLMSGGQKGLKNYFEDFQFFWVHLVGEGRDDLYDGKMLSFIIEWLSSLSHSKFRPIRHTSTAALFAMGQTLTDILTVELKGLARVEVVLESENESGVRLNRLQTQRTEAKERKKCSQRIRTLRETVDFLLSEVLSFRCKDVMSEIRSLCAQYLGTVMTKCPQLYITDQTVAFLSLMLYDKNSDVRGHVLTFLEQLYSSEEETVQKLRKFTDKQRLRLIEICHDVDPKCCVRALKVCSHLLLRGELQEEEIDLLSCLMWEETEEIRKAAGEFVATWLFEPGQQMRKYGGSTGVLDQGRRIEAEKVVATIIRFFREFGDRLWFRVKLMVQVFWDRAEMARLWEVYCDLLQRGGRGNATELDIDDGLVILHVLKSSLELLSESEKAASKPRLAELSGLLFERLVHILPLCQHSAELTQVLADIVPVLDLGPISSKDIRGSVIGLLDELRLVFQRHSDPSLLMAIMRGFDHLCNYPHPLQKEAKELLMKTGDEVLNELKPSLDSLLAGKDEKGGVLEVLLTRLASLSAVEDLVEELSPQMFDDITRVLAKYRAQELSSSMLAVSALKTLFFFHLWSLSRVALLPASLEQYLQCRNRVIDELTTTMTEATAAPEVKDAAFTLLCETLMVSSGGAADGQAIYFEVNYSLHRALCEFAESIEIKPVVPEYMRPAKAFKKLLIKGEPAEDADMRSLDLIMLLGRVICNCPTITHSNLSSSFLAVFGTSQLKSVFSLVKQVVSFLRNRDALQIGAFRNKKLYFDILLGAMFKCFDTRKRELKELSKRLASLQGVGVFKPHQAAGLKDMLLEGIQFALHDTENIPFLEAMSAFLTKGFLTTKIISEIWESVGTALQTTRESVDRSHPGRLDVLQDLSNFHALLMKLAGLKPGNPTIANSSKKARASSKSRRSSARRSVKVEAAEPPKPRSPSSVSVKEEEPRPPARQLNFDASASEGRRSGKKKAETTKVLQNDPLEMTGSVALKSQREAEVIDETDVTPGKRKKRSQVHDSEGEVEEPVGRSRKSAQRRRKTKH